MIIAFEGVDTVGKSTQIELARKSFPDALVTKEPGGTPLGAKLRIIILEEGNLDAETELLLFLADRAEHTRKVLKPNRDRLIFTDRSVVSGIAYAMGRFPLEELIALNRFATEGILPDLVLLFQTTRECATGRLEQKQHDTIESRGIDYLMQIQEQMRRTVETLKLPYAMIDATQPIDAIARQIISTIRQCQ